MRTWGVERNIAAAATVDMWVTEQGLKGQQETSGFLFNLCDGNVNPLLTRSPQNQWVSEMETSSVSAFIRRVSSSQQEGIKLRIIIILKLNPLENSARFGN